MIQDVASSNTIEGQHNMPKHAQATLSMYHMPKSYIGLFLFEFPINHAGEV